MIPSGLCLCLVGRDCRNRVAVWNPPEEGEAEDKSLPVRVMEELVARLLTLPQELRDVVCWRFMGMEYQDIAKKQRITAAGAEARHRRAMRMFPELSQLFILKTTRMKTRQEA